MWLVHSGGQNLNFPVVFKRAGKNKRKIKKKEKICAKSVFDKIHFVVFFK